MGRRQATMSLTALCILPSTRTSCLLTAFTVFVVMFLCSGPPACEAVNVNIAVLLPFDDSYLFSYRRVSPAIQMAIDSLKDPRLHLTVHYNDSKCNIAEGIDRAINFYIKQKVDVFLGPVCDFAVAPVARQTSFWKVPIISPGAFALDFSLARSTTYHLLTCVGPVNFVALSNLISEQWNHFSWKKIKLLYSKDGQDFLMKGFCHLCTEALHYTLKAQRPDLDQDLHRMDEKQEDFSAMLREEVGLDHGVVVLCASPDSVREIMIKAHELNFDNGEYVFFNIDLFTSKNASERPWYRAGDTEERNSKARKAYEALMTVTLRKPTSPEYRRFSTEVKQKAEEMYAADNFTYGEDEVNSFVGAFHDAVILYALALNESLQHNISIADGSEITKRMWNRTFEGITGTVSIDANGDRNADYSLLDLDPVEDKFKVVANYYGNRKKYEPVKESVIAWAGGMASAPPDTPLCGFDGSKCPPEEPFPEYGIVIIVLGSIILIVLVAAFFIYRWGAGKNEDVSAVDSLPFQPLVSNGGTCATA